MKQRFYICRGLPGSGKSTLAKMIADAIGADHFEADMYFMIDGEYRFDITKLHQAHSWCQRMVESSLKAGNHCIVSNTFTTQKELSPYLRLAKINGLIPMVITCHGSYGSIHDVPEEAMDRMKTRFVFDVKLDVDI